MLVVDPWMWLKEDGSLPTDNPRLRRRIIRVARFIEYGGDLAKLESRETLMECRRRPAGQPCPGFLWVTKTQHDDIISFCMVCRDEEVCVQNWQGTEWASGMMEPVGADPVPTDPVTPPSTHGRN
jgi:hypothetical protein